jgi:hypothetical protein
MANGEILTLDGLGFYGEDFTQNIWIEAFEAPVPKAKPEWIGAADSEWQALIRSPLHENREITLRLRVKQQATMDLALDQIGAIRDKLRKASLTESGIAMTWAPAASTRTVTFDVLAGEIEGMPITWNGEDAGWFQRRPVVTVKFTAKPYWRGSEYLTSTASSSTPLVTLEVANVPGDIPALGRLIVTDTATQNRRHLEWGLEGQYYNAATSLLIDSDSMTVSGFAGAQASGGGYDPNATGNNVIRATLYSTPLTVCSTGDQSHVGRFRVKARVSPSATPVAVRLAWQVGDGPWSRNPWATLEDATGFHERDLGMIHVPPVTAGTQRWRGQIEAYSTTDGTTVDVDYLVLMPVDAGYGKARATYTATAGVLNGYDRFKATTAGNALNTRSAPVGGAWATSGATTDFVFSDGVTLGPDDVESVQRETTADTAFGRFGLLSATTYTDTEVGVAATYDEITGSANGDLVMGVVSRYVNATNFLRTGLYYDNTARVFKFETRLIAASATVLLKSQDVQGSRARVVLIPAAAAYRIVNIVYATGRFYSALYALEGGGPLVELNGQDSRLATAGTHATGQRGIIDQSAGAATLRRYYGDFYAAVPAPEPMVIFSGRSAQVRHDDTLRLDSGGTIYGRPQSYNGSRLLLPPGTSRVAVKVRRMDIDADQDLNVTDATQIQVGFTPRGLVVPR